LFDPVTAFWNRVWRSVTEGFSARSHQPAIEEKTIYKIEAIVAIKGNPVTLAASRVLSTLLGVREIWLDPESVRQTSDLPRQSVLVLAENQIYRGLAALRLNGFEGAVLVLSYNEPEVVEDRYPILTYGENSHFVCTFPWQLSKLLANSTKSIPIDVEDNLYDLQQRLKAPVHKLEQEIITPLKNLQENGSNIERELVEIRDQFTGWMQKYTPDFAHNQLFTENGTTVNTYQKFVRSINSMIQSKLIEEENMKIVFDILEEWKAHVLITGEGFESFSEQN